MVNEGMTSWKGRRVSSHSGGDDPTHLLLPQRNKLAIVLLGVGKSRERSSNLPSKQSIPGCRWSASSLAGACHGTRPTDLTERLIHVGRRRDIIELPLQTRSHLKRPQSALGRVFCVFGCICWRLVRDGSRFRRLRELTSNSLLPHPQPILRTMNKSLAQMAKLSSRSTILRPSTLSSFARSQSTTPAPSMTSPPPAAPSVTPSTAPPAAAADPTPPPTPFPTELYVNKAADSKTTHFGFKTVPEADKESLGELSRLCGRSHPQSSPLLTLADPILSLSCLQCEGCSRLSRPRTT